MMNNPTLIALVAVLPTLILYLAFGFVVLDWNVTNWDSEARGLLMFIGFTLAVPSIMGAHWGTDK